MWLPSFAAATTFFLPRLTALAPAIMAATVPLLRLLLRLLLLLRVLLLLVLVQILALLVLVLLLPLPMLRVR